MQISVERGCQHESGFLRMKSDIRERTTFARPQTRKSVRTLGHLLDVSPAWFSRVEDVAEPVFRSDRDESQAGTQVKPRCESAPVRTRPVEPLDTDRFLVVSGPELPEVPQFDSVR